MSIIVRLDVMLAKRKVRSNQLAEAIGITESNLSLLKSGRVRGVRFSTLEAICKALDCQPGDLLEYVPDEKRAKLRKVGEAMIQRAITAVFLCVLTAGQVRAQTAGPPWLAEVSIPSTHRIKFTSPINSESYTLFIHVPLTPPPPGG